MIMNQVALTLTWNLLNNQFMAEKGYYNTVCDISLSIYYVWNIFFKSVALQMKTNVK